LFYVYFVKDKVYYKFISLILVIILAFKCFSMLFVKLKMMEGPTETVAKTTESVTMTTVSETTSVGNW